MFCAHVSSAGLAAHECADANTTCADRRLYRGVSKLYFENALLDGEGRIAAAGSRNGDKLFVEPGFSSATPNLHVALQYAGSESSTLFEIDTGGVDRVCRVQGHFFSS